MTTPPGSPLHTRDIFAAVVRPHGLPTLGLPISTQEGLRSMPQVHGHKLESWRGLQGALWMKKLVKSWS